MSDPIRDEYQRKLSNNDELRSRLGVPTVLDDEQDESESAPEAPSRRGSDIDQGNRGGPLGIGGLKSPAEQMSEALRASYRKSKSAASAIELEAQTESNNLADMD